MKTHRLLRFYSQLRIGVLGLFLYFSFVQGTLLFSNLLSNIGWVQLTQGILRTEEAYKIQPDQFLTAVRTNPANKRAYIGAGMAYAANLEESEALHFWYQGNAEPTTLYEMGKQLRDRGFFDMAFVYFRNADALESTEENEGSFLAGRLCQFILAEPESVSVENQKYCRHLFASHKNNLLLNGQFDYALNMGWNGVFFFTDPSTSRAELDLGIGLPPPSLKLTGVTEGRHSGMYQRIALSPGTTVHFSGYFRIESTGDLATPLLYVEWKNGGKVHGSYFYKAESSMDWTYLERTITLPLTSEAWMNFYPALLTGQGVVWTDNVAVKVLNQNKGKN